MKQAATATFIASLLLLTGCAVSYLPISSTSSPNLSGNWVIESTAGASSGTVPPAGLLLLGSLTSQGSSVSGIFRVASLSLPNTCGIPLQQVVTVAGSIDSNRNMKLTSAAFGGSTLTMQFALPPTPSPAGATATAPGLNGTVAITGGSCPSPSTTAVGLQLASLSGTYAGSVRTNPYFPLTSITSGVANLTLTQAATPQADGQIPVSGTLGFTGGGCTSSTPLTGTVSGPLLTLASAPTAPSGTATNNMAVLINPAAGQLNVASLVYGLGPCNAGLTSITQFTGNLTKQ